MATECLILLPDKILTTTKWDELLLTAVLKNEKYRDTIKISYVYVVHKNGTKKRRLAYGNYL